MRGTTRSYPHNLDHSWDNGPPCQCDNAPRLQCPYDCHGSFHQFCLAEQGSYTDCTFS